MWMQDISQVMSLFSSISYSFNYLLQTIGTSVVCDALFVFNCSGNDEQILVKMTDCSFDEYILSLCSWVGLIYIVWQSYCKCYM